MSSLKLISATDTQYSATVLKSMNEQRNHGLFCDVTIIIQDKKFRAHKTILSASSTYFHQLFSVAGQVIELNFIRAEIFEEILNYIYSSKIIRVRSDMLEELISAGQILGVKFIANLGVPLSQVKGLPGLSKETENKGDMPIITESFSISAEEFNQARKKAEKDEDSDNDVMFISKTDAQTRAVNQKKPSVIIDLDAADSEEDLVSNKNQEESGAVKKVQETSTEHLDADGAKPSDPNTPPKTLPENNHLSSPDTSPNIPSSPTQAAPTQASPTQAPPTQASPTQASPTQASPTQASPTQASPTQASPTQASPTQASPTQASPPSAPTMPAKSSNFTPKPSSTAPQQPTESSEITGVHKKQVSTTPQQGDFKVRLLDVSVGTINNTGLNVPKSVVAAKKTITLDKASEIDSISTGCKVYANIGEDTYDIVPVKEDPGEGGSRGHKGKRSLMATPLKPYDKAPISPKGGSNKKKTKMELEDHYELIMDGKTFYVCIVCKRPYVCLTSLRRHFNTHSWEKKYPCHYCDKVFALAEYRTKHEIHHTGERRYQCLLCNEMFMNYQVLSTHCKQAHNQDPSGRKEKDDTDNNLYRLHPCKTLQLKSYSWASDDGAGIPVLSEDGSVHHLSPAEEAQSSAQSKMLNWDDIFIEPDAHMRPGAHARPGTNMNPPSHGSSEFEFVIPETY